VITNLWYWCINFKGCHPITFLPASNWEGHIRFYFNFNKRKFYEIDYYLLEVKLSNNDVNKILEAFDTIDIAHQDKRFFSCSKNLKSAKTLQLKIIKTSPPQ